ncbi:FlgD immunoglobulin-like domain containing protein [uncultured Nocardioides sp.]|uniref:FlgD immunoglobulin-like domain containing protein n=1 Tax=uncultured Nocardioides sp. TaxID=198441 RepID=UPI00263665A2|nr:FlgD immunoglobulin-like domain containing protein [uncultured Nocardioides sp.]
MVTGLVLLAGGTSGPASAGSGSERGPAVGFVEGSPGTVEAGWTGPLTVAGFSTTEDFVYRLAVRGPDDYEVTRRFVLGEGESMREEVRLRPATATGSYRAVLSDPSGPVDSVRFRVAAATAEAPLRIESAPPAVFLPRVRDGVRDVARMRYSVAVPASVVGRVLDPDGRVVRQVGLGRPAPGEVHDWTWDGRGEGGVVERGDYRMRLTATTADGTTSAGRGVRVASYRVPVDRRVERPGMTTSSRSPGACRLAATEGRGLDVDCRSARTGATLRYWFATGARAARWKVAGEGTSSRSAERLGRGTAVVVRVPAGSRWRTDQVVAAWRSDVLR